jgi:DeoR/GlpR family transcriptional regulator of sugar metabolism
MHRAFFGRPCSFVPLTRAFGGGFLAGSVAGLTEEGGFDSSPEDTQIKRGYIERADQVILLCDSSKFGQRSLAQACTLDEIDMVITDAAPPPALAAALKAAHVVVRVASKA